MQARSNQNSALKTPLSTILGSKGQIEVLRCLVDLKSAASHSELMRRTGLSRQGVYDVVNRLVQTGIIKYVGSGVRQQVQFRQKHPLASSIRQLFVAEKKRYHLLIQRLKKELQEVERPLKSAWLFGKVARGMDEYGDPLQIALLGDPRFIDFQTDTLRDRLVRSGIETEYDVTIELRGCTIADLESALDTELTDIILLWGVDPKQLLKPVNKESSHPKTHQDFDAQSLQDAKAWTDLLQKHPEIIRRTIQYLEERIPEIHSGEKKELREWEHLLKSMSFQRLKKFLESDTDRSLRLRQSLPFWQVLTAQEQEEFRQLRSQHAK